MKKHILLIVFICFSVLSSYTQNDLLSPDFILLPAEEQSAQFENVEYLIESWREDFQKKGLDLNAAALDDLVSTGLSLQQAEAIIQYRSRVGRLSCIEELQCVSVIPIEWLRTNKSLMYCSTQAEKWTASKVFSSGEYRILSRYKQRLPVVSFHSSENALPGDLWLRFQYRNPGFMSWSLSMIQGANEPFFSKTQKQGFAAYSGYVEWDVRRRGLEKFLIGDYSLGLGQGLTLWRCWAPPAGGASLLRWRSSARGNAGSSRDRSLRGMYALWKIHTSISLETFASIQPLAASTDSNQNVLAVYPGEKAITPDQLQRRNKTLLFLSGAALQCRLKGLNLSLQSMYAGYSKPFSPISAPHNKDDWSGKPIVLSSLDGVLFVHSWQVYMELAYASNNAFACIAGLQHQVASSFETGFFCRIISKKYPLFFASPPGAYSVPGQEYQLWGNFTPNLKNKLSYSIQYTARSGISYPRNWPYRRISILSDYTFTKKRSFSFSLAYKFQSQWENLYVNTEKLYQPVMTNFHSAQFSLDATPAPFLKYKLEVRWMYEKNTQSIFCAQSIICKGPKLPLQISAGIRFFHVSANSRPVYDVQYEMPYSTGLYILTGSGFQYDVSLGTKKFGPFRMWVRWNSSHKTSFSNNTFSTKPHDSQISVQTEWTF